MAFTLTKIPPSEFVAAGKSSDPGNLEDLGLYARRHTETIAASTDADVTLDIEIPTYSEIAAIGLKAVGAVSIATGTSIGIGDGTDIDKFAEITVSGNLNTAGDIVWLPRGLLDASDYAAGGSIVLTATNGSGVAAGTFTTTELDVIIYTESFVGFGV